VRVGQSTPLQSTKLVPIKLNASMLKNVGLDASDHPRPTFSSLDYMAENTAMASELAEKDEKMATQIFGKLSTNSTAMRRHEELQYLDLVQQILTNGEHRPDRYASTPTGVTFLGYVCPQSIPTDRKPCRTGTGTYSIFAPTPLKFSLNDGGQPILPLLTTKRVFLKAVIAELLWFIEGNTSSKSLSEAGVKIWDGNGSREFLDSVGLSHREVGDLGPVYGFQWRHFGAEYVDAMTDYTGQGVDQLAEVIHKLRNNPYDRRIIMSAWNPADLKKMALPPCHMFAQFYVSYPRTRSSETQENGGEKKKQGYLHCQLYQRSCDMGLGVPFNIASYALLTHMIAHVCELVPGSLTHVMGDAHVYCDHVDALNVQLEREPRPFPTLEIAREKGGSIDGWKVEDFIVKDYNPHKTIAMKMSV